MPPRKRKTATEPTTRPASGAAMRLPDGGEAIFLRQEGEFALLRVGTGHARPLKLPMEGLEAVDEGSGTEKHAKFRADAVRRGEIGA